MTTRTAPIPLPVVAGSGGTLRPWRGLDDLDAMAAANARLRERAGLLETMTAETLRHRFTHLVNSDPVTDCLVLERDGAIRGYVRVEWHDLVDGLRSYDTTLVVEPSCWGLGLTEAMLAWSEARAAGMAAEHPTERPSVLDVFAFERDDGISEALDRAGYQAVRWFAEMLRPDMEGLPRVEQPDGYVIRAPDESEFPAVFEMLIAAFAEHWGEAGADEWRIDEWTEDPRFRLDLVVVAWRGDTPASAVANVLEPAPGGTIRGLLDAVATHPDHRRRGLARACIARSLELLQAEGAASAYLGVDTDNHNQALALYEACGFRVASRSAVYRRPLPGQESFT